MVSRQKLSPCPRCRARIALTVDTAADASTLRGGHSYQVHCGCGLHERGLAFSSGRREAAIDEWNTFAAGERSRIRTLAARPPATAVEPSDGVETLIEKSALRALELLDRAGLLRMRPDLDSEQTSAVRAAATVLLQHSLATSQARVTATRTSSARPSLAGSNDEAWKDQSAAQPSCSSKSNS